MIDSMKSSESLDRLGRDLLDAFNQVIRSLPGEPNRPQRFARNVGVNKDVASRLFAAVRSKDPLDAIHRLPGSTALRQVLQAAELRGADGARVKTAHTALSTFDSFVQDHFDDRAGLDAFIGASLPIARRKIEAAAKQAIFRGSAVLKGVTSDAMVSTFITYPSTGHGDQLCDLAVINGFVGIRRMRPGAQIQFSHKSNTADYDKIKAIDLGDPPESHLLRDFCSPATLPLSIQRDDKAVTYSLQDTGVGPKSAIDMFMADHFPSNYSRYRTAVAPGSKYFYALAAYPTKAIIIDMFVHADLWPGDAPTLRIYDTDQRGIASVNDRGRDSDRLETTESIELLGNGVERTRCADIPRYDELLRQVFRRLDLDSTNFRCFRCRIAYPVPSWQITMEFRPPQPPGMSAAE